MTTKIIDTDEELAIVEAAENGEYVPLPKDEFEHFKQLLNTAATETTNLNNDTDTAPR